jgi:pimeloyl-ACP methyl ester carboxylesterase
MATFILVPGGWHGGWYFETLAEALRARGHRAYPVTLAGLGQRRQQLHADINLDTHIQDVLDLLRTQRLREVVLVGHSYAGMVLSGTIDRAPDLVRAAIYCDAYVPEDGQSCFDLVNDTFREFFLKGAAADGFTVAPPSHLDRRATPHPLATLLQRLRVKSPLPAIPLGYIYLSGWSETPFKHVYERLRASPQWRTFELPVAHNIVAEAPDEFLNIILQFA